MMANCSQGREADFSIKPTASFSISQQLFWELVARLSSDGLRWHAAIFFAIITTMKQAIHQTAITTRHVVQNNQRCSR